MDSIVPRLQVFEIDDQPWFPGFLRSRIQSILTGLWTTRIPIVQRVVPAAQTARILHETLGDEAIRRYTVVDFCSGAGGPTPSIERALNERLSSSSSSSSSSSDSEVDFVLTDIAPHPKAWAAASQKSQHLHYIPEVVDATAAPKPASLLAQAGLPERRVLRTFHLSFHHFSDANATAILKDTFRTADGIVIVELVERRFTSILLNLLLVVPLGLGTPFLYWNDPIMLFFTYLLPVIPAVTIFDGLMSSLRCRTADEIMSLVEKAQVNEEVKNWEWRWGREMHTFPFGFTNYFIGWRKS